MAFGGSKFRIKAHTMEPDQPLTVDLVFTLVDLVEPLPVIDVALPVASSKAQLQVPLYVHQEVRTTVSVQPDESVVVAGLHGDTSDEILLVVLRVAPVLTAASQH